MIFREVYHYDLTEGNNNEIVTMNNIEVSCMVFKALSEIEHIETSLVSMWSLSNKYVRIPFLRFRWKGLSKGDPLYARLKDVIDNYSGNVRWSVTTRDDVPNYILIPKMFERNFLERMSISKEELLTNLTEEEYREAIDTVIADVPNLAIYISTSFGRDLERSVIANK